MMTTHCTVPVPSYTGITLPCGEPAGETGRCESHAEPRPDPLADNESVQQAARLMGVSVEDVADALRRLADAFRAAEDGLRAAVATWEAAKHERTGRAAQRSPYGPQGRR